MIITTNEQDAMQYAQVLDTNVKISNGINWHWAAGFRSEVTAKLFDAYCKSINLETRGVYSNADGTADVRFRD